MKARWAIVTVLLLGCGKQDKETLIFGQVVDASSGAGLPGATVGVGDNAVTANEAGFFTLSGVPGGERVLVSASTDGYAQGTKAVQLSGGSSTFVKVSLLPFVGTASFDAGSGGTVAGSGASVTFGANAFAGASGQVTAHLAWLDPSDPAALAAFPGDFTTDDGEMLESFGAIAVEVRDGTGGLLQLAGGQSADAVVPVVGAGVTDTIPLWSFDTSTGRWVEEGQLSGCLDGSCEGSLPHLSWWNADKVMETTCLDACVEDTEGEPAAGVAVEAHGIDYQGTSYGYTGEDGCTCLDVRIDSKVEVVGVYSGGVATLPAPLDTPDTPGTCGDGDCTSLDSPLVVSPPYFQAILTWGAEPYDLDSHITGPCYPDDTGCTERFHVYYSNRGSLTSAPWAFLDTDDTSAYGPEITTLIKATDGVYRFSVDNYSGAPGFDVSDAQVLLFLPGGEFETVTVPGGTPDLTWIVGDLTCNASRCTWQTLNDFAPEGQHDP